MLQTYMNFIINNPFWILVIGIVFTVSFFARAIAGSIPHINWIRSGAIIALLGVAITPFTLDDRTDRLLFICGFLFAAAAALIWLGLIADWAVIPTVERQPIGDTMRSAADALRDRSTGTRTTRESSNQAADLAKSLAAQGIDLQPRKAVLSLLLGMIVLSPALTACSDIWEGRRIDSRANIEMSANQANADVQIAASKARAIEAKAMHESAAEMYKADQETVRASIWAAQVPTVAIALFAIVFVAMGFLWAIRQSDNTTRVQIAAVQSMHQIDDRAPMWAQAIAYEHERSLKMIDSQPCIEIDGTWQTMKRIEG